MESNDGRREYIVPLSDDEAFYGFKDVAAHLIRCKDCKYYLTSDEECQLINTRLHFYEENKKWTKESFCSWARREEDDDRAV